jgi:hypothetical protein
VPSARVGLVFGVDLRGWYWTPENELRECVVVYAAGDLAVLDAETLEEVSVNVEDVMVEKPE